MEYETFILRAFFWSIILGVLVNPRRLRLGGLGVVEVGPLKLFGYTAAAGALMLGLDTSRIPSSVELIRGGAPKIEFAEVKKMNPAFRVRRRDGSLKRMLLENLRVEFVAFKPLKVRRNGKESEMTAEQIERVVLDEVLRDWVIWESQVKAVPITPALVDEWLSIVDRLSKELAFESATRELVLKPGRSGYTNILTATGEPIEVPDSEIPTWIKAQSVYVHGMIAGRGGLEEANHRTLNDIKLMVDYYMSTYDKTEVFNELEGRFVLLDRPWLAKLLDFENRIQVAWEDQWVTVSEDFFEFMRQRIQQWSNNEQKPEPPPPSLERFLAPVGFDPLKMNRDGLFLVTPTMEEIEMKRPIFTFTYFHVPGYCYGGVTALGVGCETTVNERRKSFCIRGLTGHEKEIDDIQFANPDLEELPADLQAKYANDPEHIAVRDALKKHFVPLLKDDTTFLTEQYQFLGKYLQMYAEVRSLLGWLQKTLELAERFDFERMMTAWKENNDGPGKTYLTHRPILEQHLAKHGFKRPMLSCRESVGVKWSALRMLSSITICMNRDYELIDCTSSDTCGASFNVFAPHYG